MARPNAVGMRELWSADFRNGRNDLSRHAHAIDDLVPRYVVGNQPKDGHQRARLAEDPGLGQLPDRLGMASQIAAGNGPPRARSSGGQRRSR